MIIYIDKETLEKQLTEFAVLIGTITQKIYKCENRKEISSVILEIPEKYQFLQDALWATYMKTLEKHDKFI